MPGAEEIAEGHNHARRGLVVPIDLDENLSIVERVGHFPIEAERVVNLEDRRDVTAERRIDQPGTEDAPAELGHPDMSDAARPGDVGESYAGMRGDQPI